MRIYCDMRITVIAHPKAKKPRIEKDLTDTYHVYVREPPLDGRANLAIRESLADYFGVRKNVITLVLGNTSKLKIFDIKGNS